MAHKEQHVEKIIRQIIEKEVLKDEPGITLDYDLNLLEKGVIDSLGIFTLVELIEKEFGIAIELEEVVLENFATVNAIKQLVQAKLAPKE